MKILIVDDEPLARERLNEMIKQMDEHEAIGNAKNGREAVEFCNQHAVDIVLMDIAMPLMDGLEAARHLSESENPPAVVFCTAYDDHALAAFEAAAVDYVLKPVRQERLTEALKRAVLVRTGQSTSSKIDSGKRRTHFSARLRGMLRLIPVEEVSYLRAEEKYVVVHHGRGEDLIEESLKSLETEFGDQFIRIHRNCLVASDQFSELIRDADGRTLVVLRDGTKLEVSRRAVSSVRDKILHL